MRTFRRRIPLLIAAATLAACAQAATYQWDVNGSTAGLGGTGTWDTALFYWDQLGTGTDAGLDTTVAYTFTSADTAIFGGTADRVTINNTGGVTVNSIRFDTAGYILDGTGTTGTITLAGVTPGFVVNADATVNAVITDTGAAGLQKTGAAILTLTAANTYTGPTVIKSGKLKLKFDAPGAPTTNILTGGSALTLAGGTLELAGTGTQTLGGLTTAAGTGNQIILGADETLTLGTLTSVAANSSLNFNTTAGGANATTATLGTGVIVLTGQTAGNAINSLFTVSDAGGFGLATVNGSNQVVRLTTTALLPASGATSSTDYRIDNNGGDATAAGSATLALTTSASAKSITVDTSARSGTLTLNSGVLLSTNTWNFGGVGSNTYQITGNAGGAGLKSVASGDTIVINNYNAGTVTFSSPILANGTNALIVNGTGTTVFSGANTFTGGITVNAGTLMLNREGEDGVSVLKGAVVVNTGATLNWSQKSVFGYNANTISGLTINGGTVGGGDFRQHFYNNTGSLPITFTGGELILGGLATVDGGNMFYNAPITVIASANQAKISGTGAFVIRDDGTQSFNVGDGSQAVDLLVSTAFLQQTAKIGKLSKSGAGTMALTAANTYTGATTVTAGALVLTGANGSITGSAPTISGGATLRLDNTGAANNTSRLGDAVALTLGGGTLQFANDGSATAFAETTGQLNVTGFANTVVTSQSALTSLLTFASLNRTGGTIDFAGTGLGANTQNQIKFAAAPTLGNGIIGPWATYNGTNFATYDATYGVIAYTSAAGDQVTRFDGTKVIANDATKNIQIVEGSGGTNSALTLAAAITTINTLNQSVSGGTSAATIALNGANNTLSVNSILVASGSAGLTIGTTSGEGFLKNPGTALLVIENSTGGSTINAVITNGTAASSLTKSGTGTLTLAGGNTYTGSTFVDAGTLKFGVANAIAGSGIIASAGTIDLAGFNQSITGLRSDGATAPIITNSAAGAGTNTLTLTGSWYGNYSGSIQDGATAKTAVVISGANGRISFAGTNTFTGGLTVNGDGNVDGTNARVTLGIGSDAALGAVSNVVTLNNGGVLLNGISSTSDWSAASNPTLDAGRSLVMGSGVGGVIRTWGGNTFTINSTISGAGRLTKTDTGTLVLNAANTYEGGTTLTAGTIIVKNTAALGTAGRDVTLNGGTLDLHTDTSVNAWNVIVGANTTIESDRATAGNGITNTLGTLSIGAYTLNITTNTGHNVAANSAYGVTFGATTLTANATFNVANNGTGAGTLTLGNLTGGTNSLTKTGAGTLVLAGANTGSGATTVSAGTLVLIGDNSTGYTGSFTVGTGATLKLDYATSNSRKIGSGALTLSGGTLELAGGSFADSVASTALTAGPTSTITRSSGTSTLNLGAITPGSLAYLNFAQSGIARTSNANNTWGVLGSWATVGGNNWAANDGNGLIVGATTTDLTRLSSGTKTITSNAAAHINLIEGTGTAGNIQLGSATTTINSLIQSATGGATVATIDPAGQTLALNAVLVGTGAGALTIGTGTNNGTIKSAGTAIDFRDLAGAGIIVNSVVADGTGATTVNKFDGGILTFSGANTYTGGTVVNGGTLTASLGNTAGARTIFGSGAITANAGTTLHFLANSTANAMTHANAINLNSATLTSEDANQTFLGNIALTGANTVNVVYGDKSATFTGTVSGAGSLTKSGPGVLSLSGNNTYSSGTTVTGGTLRALSSGAFGAANAAITLNAASISLASDTAVSSKDLTLAGTTTTNTITLERGNQTTTWRNLTTTGSNRTLAVNLGTGVAAPATLVFNGSFTPAISGTTTTFNIGAGATLNLSGSLGGTGGINWLLTKSGAGTLIIPNWGNWDVGTGLNSGVTTLSGGTLELRGIMGDSTNCRSITASSGTTLRLAQDSNTAYYSNVTSGTNNATLNFEAGRITSGTTSVTHSLGALTLAGTGASTVNVNRAATITGAGVGTVAFTGATTMTGATTFNVGANAVLDLQGAVGGAFSLTKTGAGSLNLTAANGYSGATAISGGTLTLSGANGAIASSSGITLSGGGVLTLANTSTANNGNRIAGTLALNGGTLNFSNDGSATAFAETTGAVSVGGGTNTIFSSQSASTSTLAFGTLSRTAGTVNFSGTGLGADARNRITFSGGVTSGQMIGTWATYNGTDFAAYDSTNGVVAYTSVAGDQVTRFDGTKVIANDATKNIQIVEGSGGTNSALTLAAAATTINTLNQSVSGGTSAATIALNSANNTLSVNSILVASGSAGLTIGTTSGEGFLKNPGTALLVIENSTGGSTINAVIANGTSASTFTKSGTGQLTLAGTNTYTGATTIEAGTLSISSNANLGAPATGAGITLNGGTLKTTATLALDNAGANIRAITIGAAGGTFDVDTGTTLTASGGFTGTGNTLNKIGAGTMIVSGSSTLGAINVSGGGTLTLNQSGMSFSNATGWGGGAPITVTGANSTLLLANVFNAGYSRPVTIDGGVLNLTSSSAADSQNYINNLTLTNGAQVTGNAPRMGYHSNAVVTVGGTSAASMSAGLRLLNGSSSVVRLDVADVTSSSATDFTISGAITDDPSLTGTPLIKSGAGTLLLSGNNSFGGTTTVSGGMLQVGHAAALGGTTNGTTVNVGGTLDLNGFNIGSEIVTLAGGTLTNSSTTAAGVAATIAVSAPSFVTAPTSQWVRIDSTSGSGSLNLSGTAGTYTGGSSTTWAHTGGTVLTNGGLDVYGGTTITGGPITINGGSFNTKTADRIGDSLAVTVNGGTWTLSGNDTIGSLAGTGGTVALGTSALTIGAANTSTSFGGNISSTSAAGAIIKMGTGTWTLNSPNAASIAPQGGITVNGGALVMNASSSWPTYSGGAITLNNGTSLTISGSRFDFSNTNFVFGTAGGSTIFTTAGTNTVGQGGTWTFTTNGGLKNTIGGTGGLNTNGNIITFDIARGTDALSDLDVNVVMGNTSYANENLTKNGAGILTLNATNTYKGSTTINAGTLRVSADGNLGTAPGSATAGKLVLNGGTLAVTTGFTLNSNRGIALGPTTGTGAGTLDIAANQTLTYGGIIANTGGTGSLTKTGSGTLTLSGANTYSGITTIDGGNLRLDANTGTLANTSALQVNNGGTLEFYASTGNNKNSLGSTTKTITVGTGGTLLISTNNTMGYSANSNYANVVLDGGTFTLNAQQYINNLTLNATTGGTVNGTGALYFYQETGNAITANASASIANNIGFHTGSTHAMSVANGQTLTLGGTISTASGTTGLIKSGLGTLVLNGTNSYNGKTTVANGTLSFSAGNASATANQQLGTNAAVDLGVAGTSSGTLRYTGAAGTLAKNINAIGNGSDTVQNAGSGLLTLSGTLTKNGTVLTLKGGASGINVTGSIAGASANSDLVIDGGITTLSGANTYNGPTFIKNTGTLITANTSALGAGDVSVESGSTLQIGNGTTNSVTLGSGADLIVAGQLKLGAANSTVTMSGGGAFDFTGGSVFIGSLFDTNTALTPYQLISGATGTGTVNVLGFDTNVFSDVDLDSNGYLVFTAIPEPSVYGLLGAGALALVAHVRRRRRLAK